MYLIITTILAPFLFLYLTKHVNIGQRYREDDAPALLFICVIMAIFGFLTTPNYGCMFSGRLGSTFNFEIYELVG